MGKRKSLYVEEPSRDTVKAEESERIQPNTAKSKVAKRTAKSKVAERTTIYHRTTRKEAVAGCEVIYPDCPAKCFKLANHIKYRSTNRIRDSRCTGTCACDKLNHYLSLKKLCENTRHTKYIVLHFNEAVVMVLLDNDGFLTGLTRLFQQTRNSGSLFLTMKKYNGRTKPRPKAKAKGKAGSPEPEDHLCLLRASNGKKKISTVISAREVTRFQMAYANLLKANMDGLKKRDKRTAKAASKAKKAKATQ